MHGDIDIISSQGNAKKHTNKTHTKMKTKQNNIPIFTHCIGKGCKYS